MKTFRVGAVTGEIERLPAQLARRNWLVLAVLLVCSLLFADSGLSLGVLAGGLVAIGAFSWMQRSLRKLLEQPDGGSRSRFQIGYLLRLVALGCCLAVLVAIVKVDPLGLVIGLSVVVINLIGLTIQRVLR